MAARLHDQGMTSPWQTGMSGMGGGMGGMRERKDPPLEARVPTTLEELYKGRYVTCQTDLAHFWHKANC